MAAQLRIQPGLSEERVEPSLVEELKILEPRDPSAWPLGSGMCVSQAMCVHVYIHEFIIHRTRIVYRVVESSRWTILQTRVLQMLVCNAWHTLVVFSK